MVKYATSLSPMDIGSNLNALQYIIRGCIDNMVNTMLIVRVTAVNGDKIDVQTVISDLDNEDSPIGTYSIPSVRYIKWQYGTNAIIGTPKIGDIGILLISKQDTSGLVKTGESICQTKAVFNVGDGIYLGGLNGLNAAPTQFLEFADDSIKLTGTGTVTIEAPTVEVKTTTANIKATDATIEATDTTIKATNATIDSSNIKLGGSSASKKIALDGDTVKNGNTVVGTIVASSVSTLAL